MKTIIDELIEKQQRNRRTLDIQGKALAQMIRYGEAELHTVTFECLTGKNGETVNKNYSFYKTRKNYMYHAKPELIQQHRAYLMAKYNGRIPYKYE